MLKGPPRHRCRRSFRLHLCLLLHAAGNMGIHFRQCRRRFFMRPAEDKKQQTRRQPLHTAAVGRIVLEFIPSEQHRGIGGKRQLRIAAAARPFFQRMQRAPTDLEMRARIRSRHAEQGKKSKIITQSHTRQRTVPFSKALAQRTIHAR